MNSLDELVLDRKNGLIFNTSEQLASHMAVRFTVYFVTNTLLISRTGHTRRFPRLLTSLDSSRLLFPTERMGVVHVVGELGPRLTTRRHAQRRRLELKELYRLQENAYK